ncbi:hypothetical protein ACT3SP_09645 [Brachybacterium sp. AOP43-C2-M15]|uniref:hypothetical protein n=1 Tax=Brachybacterium sp. AOP43-C2-M15 TaxID=3457661 RepID=UPI0040347681
MSTPMNNSLPWPDTAEVLPLASVRPVLDRLSSLVNVHEQDATAIPGLAVTEEEVAADPPPALEQIADELGGVRVCGQTMLTLQIEDRTDVGPYTLLGEATSFYPLYETPDAAVVLTLDEDGAPGAVHGIGEDLALRLAAPDLGTYLELFADALETTLTALAERGPAAADVEDDRAEAAERLMDQHLFARILGTTEEDEAPEVPLQDPVSSDLPGLPGLPEGTLAVADLRGAPLGARADLMEVETPGDPLAMRVAFRERGLVVAVLGD